MSSFFARNGVAANLIMVLVFVGGAVSVFSIKQEVFPEFSLDLITVTVRYRSETSVPIVGALLDDVILTESTTMRREAP